MRFVKGGISQAMLHDLKYHDNKKIGIWMGELFGLELKTDPRFASIDCIIPVPLHPSKMRLRGYNQSELIAKGMARQLQVPVDTQTLVRKIASDTQTHKTRIERWLNVDGNFCVRNSYTEPIHVLLVDDVLTTGATIEACAQVLLQIPGLTLSIACIAKA
jgi:ComF family protein